MWDFRNKKRIQELEGKNTELKSKIFDLERDVFETQSFERIASEKLKIWVTKHDELLIKYKELLKNNKPKAKKHDKNVTRKKG